MKTMTKQEAINYLQQIYPQGGHCWLDEQRIEAIGMAVDALKEESVNDEFEAALAKEWKGYNDRGAAKVDALEDNTQELAFAKGFYRGWHYQKQEPVSEDLEKDVEKEWNCYSKDGDIAVINKLGFKLIARHFAQWQKQRDNIPAKDLEELINKLSGQFPEVSFAKLSRIAVRVSNWQRERMEKEYSDLNKGLVSAKGLAVSMAYEKGKEYMREQMAKDAVDGVVEEPNPLQWRIISEDLEGEFVVKHRLVDGTNVKLIIINEK